MAARGSGSGAEGSGAGKGAKWARQVGGSLSGKASLWKGGKAQMPKAPATKGASHIPAKDTADHRAVPSTGRKAPRVKTAK